MNKSKVILLALIGSVLVPAAASAEPRSMFDMLRGEWVANDGRGFKVDEFGRVWSHNGSLTGRVAEAQSGGGNFMFQGEYSGRSYRCTYDVSFLLDDNHAQWRLLPDFSTGSVPCPAGTFDRGRSRS